MILGQKRRPEKARRIIRRTIERYLNDELTAVYIPEMIRAVYVLQAKQYKWHKEHGYPMSDYCPDLNTDFESVGSEMEYISDRFDAPQRLAWLATGIEEELF